MKRIYLDYASLTPIDKGVMKQMNRYSTGDYSNPASLYASGVASKEAIKEAKERIARILHAQPDEILFTSGGTESNSLVLGSFSDKQILISAIEHSSIINNTLVGNSISNKNFIKIPVDEDGVINLDFLKVNLNSKVGLISVMLVNNEIGTIEPIHEVVKIVRDFNKKNNTNIKVHTDACQAMIHLPLYVEKLGVDMMSLDGHKIYGPRGVGMLYIKRDMGVGGGSVKKIERAGTENVPGIMGFAYAVELAEKIREIETQRVGELKEFFLSEIKKIKSGVRVNGHDNAVPSILNISMPNLDSEFFLFQLDTNGIEVSTKSACLRDEDESYVLKAIGVSSKDSIRFSFGRGTTKGELKRVVGIINRLLSK